MAWEQDFDTGEYSWVGDEGSGDDGSGIPIDNSSDPTGGTYTGERYGDNTWDGSAWVPTAQYVDPTTGSDEVIAKPGEVAGNKIWDGSAWVPNTKEALSGIARRILGEALGRNPSEKELSEGIKKLTSGGPTGIAQYLSDNKGTLLAGGLLAAVLADKDKKQETTVTTAVDPRSQAGLDIAATDIINNKYDPKTGLSADVKSNLTALKTAADEKYAKDLAAGLDPNQTKAAGIALDASDPTKNVWKDALAGAKTGTEAAMLGMKDGDLKPYINEYWRTALNPQLEQYDRDTEQQKLGLQAQAAKAGAFGGSRFGLMDTELGRNRDFVRQGTISAGAKDAFDRAANLYQGDKSRAMTGAGQLSSIGSTTAGLNTGDINNLASTGAVGQAYNQNKLTKSYDEWLRQQDAQKGYGLTALSTQVNQDAVDEKNKQFATTLPGTNATSLATLAGLNKTTKTVGTAPPLLSQLAGVGTTLFGLNKLGQ